MDFDSSFLGAQAFDSEDRAYSGSRFSEVRRALFENRYYLVWGTPGDPRLPTYAVTLGRTLAGILPFGQRWRFGAAARRSVLSHADLRWGPDGRGFRRILHPNGVCLLGRWEVFEDSKGTGYTGYFKEGSSGLLVGRYSTGVDTRRGRTRSLALVGKLYPTNDPDHREPLRTANFITQEDIGGARSSSIFEAELRNAPDVTPLRRGSQLPVFLVTVGALLRADQEPAIRQLYSVAELGKPPETETRAPEFMRLVADAEVRRSPTEDEDFRVEILSQIYNRGHAEPKRKLVFHIEVSDQGEKSGLLVKRVRVDGWRRIGRIVFEEAVCSYNGDFVLHFNHAPWREDRNLPRTVARKSLRG